MVEREIAIKVNDNNWKVAVTRDYKLLLDKNGHICKGVTSYKNRTIFIDPRMPKESFLRVLRHELGHTYLYETQININDNFTEEDVCEFIAIYGDKIVSKARSIYKKYISGVVFDNERTKNL